jgi:hypothetical protein
MRIFKIDRIIQEDGLYVCNMHNIVKKHFSITTVLVRSWGGSLVIIINYTFLSVSEVALNHYISNYIDISFIFSTKVTKLGF